MPMPMANLPATLAVPRQSNLSFSLLTLSSGIDHLRIGEDPAGSRSRGTAFLGTVIRMGGGPRTYPGGVSKWQWKRMQAKKAKQLLKARLLRERQIYEMRKRAELKAAVAELERPWEVVERAPVLFSISADEQLKALADRFHKPGGFDMWTDRDGPQVLCTQEDLPTARCFPNGSVHSFRPYGILASGEDDMVKEKDLRFDDWISRDSGGIGRSRRSSRKASLHGSKFVTSTSGEVNGSTGNLRRSGRGSRGGRKTTSSTIDVEFKAVDGETDQDRWAPSTRNSRFQPANGNRIGVIERSSGFSRGGGSFVSRGGGAARHSKSLPYSQDGGGQWRGRAVSNKGVGGDFANNERHLSGFEKPLQRRRLPPSKGRRSYGSPVEGNDDF